MTSWLHLVRLFLWGILEIKSYKINTHTFVEHGGRAKLVRWGQEYCHLLQDFAINYVIRLAKYAKFVRAERKMCNTKVLTTVRHWRE